MSCGNGSCGCCPKCGCRATCTCNQSMGFDEAMGSLRFNVMTVTAPEANCGATCACANEGFFCEATTSSQCLFRLIDQDFRSKSIKAGLYDVDA